VPSVSKVAWPEWKEELTLDEERTVVIQINGKVRSKMQVPTGTSTEQLEKLAVEAHRMQELLEGKTVLKIITVPDKLVNIVVR
jgi:leucyl-tRNA synthetase